MKAFTKTIKRWARDLGAVMDELAGKLSAPQYQPQPVPVKVRVRD